MKKLAVVLFAAFAVIVFATAAQAGDGHKYGHHKVLVCLNGMEKYLPQKVAEHNPNATLGSCPEVTPPVTPPDVTPPDVIPPVDTGGGTETPPIVTDNPPVVGVGGNVYVCDGANFSPQVSRVVNVSTLPSEYASGARLANEILGGAHDVGIQLNENGSGVFRCDVPAGATALSGVVGDGAGVLFDSVLYAEVIALHNSTVGYPVFQQS